MSAPQEGEQRRKKQTDTPWRSALSFQDQLRSNPPQGEGYLREITGARDLRAVVVHEAAERFPDSVKNQIIRAYERACELHAAAPRRRTDAEAATHPIRSGITVLQDRSFSDLHAVIMFFHDVIEDCGQTKQTVFKEAKKLDYDDAQADFIARGVDALSRVGSDGKKLEEQAYMDKLQKARPELRIPELKAIDTTDNLLDDAYLLTTRSDKANSLKIDAYLRGKVQAVTNLAETNAPGTPATNNLHEVVGVVTQAMSTEATVVFREAA